LERAIPKTKGVEFGSLAHQLGAEMFASPYSPSLHKILLEISPDAKDRLPKRAAKGAKPKESEAPAEAAKETKPKAEGPAKGSAAKKTAAAGGKKPAASQKSAAEERASAKKSAEKKKASAVGISKRKPR
jgi:hypothetical protein